MRKRGVSEVLTVVLLIGIVLAAFFIVYNVTVVMIKGSTKGSESSLNSFLRALSEWTEGSSGSAPASLNGTIEACYLGLEINETKIGETLVSGDCFDLNDNPIKICTCDDLQRMEEKLDGTYELQNDVDCSDTVNWNGGKGFEPIGNCNDGTNCHGDQGIGNPFTGLFNGRGHTITGLSINGPQYNVGLFGYSFGTIRNVGLIDVNLSGYADIGGLIGINKNGKIYNSYVTGTISGYSYIGGLVGQNHEGGVINNSYFAGRAAGTNYIGGLIGLNDDAKISNSFSSAYMSGGPAGGLIGRNSAGIISNSYWNKISPIALCVGEGSQTGCNTIQNNISYFYQSSNPPMSLWNAIIWEFHGDKLPTLKGQVSSSEPIIEFGLLNQTNLYGAYESSVNEYDSEMPGDYMLTTYDSSGNLLSNYSVYSGRFVFYDSFDEETTETSGGVFELNSSTLFEIIPYDERIDSIKIKHNEAITNLNINPGSFECVRTCKIENEVLGDDDSCCIGFIAGRNSDGDLVCVNPNDGICSEFEDANSCIGDCFNESRCLYEGCSNFTCFGNDYIANETSCECDLKPLCGGADINGDGIVNYDDFLVLQIVLSEGVNACKPTYGDICCYCDTNGNEWVDGSDWVFMHEHWWETTETPCRKELRIC